MSGGEKIPQTKSCTKKKDIIVYVHKKGQMMSIMEALKGPVVHNFHV